MYVAFSFLFFQTLGEAPEDVARDLEEELNDGRFDLPPEEQVTFPLLPSFFLPFLFYHPPSMLLVLGSHGCLILPKNLYRCSSFLFHSPVCFFGNKEFHFRLHSCPIVSLQWYFGLHS